MERDFVVIPPDLRVRDLIDDYLIGTSRRVFPVVEYDELVGLVCLADIRRVERDRQAATRVAEIMTPASKLHALAPSDQAGTALEGLTEHAVNQLPVLENGRVIGLVSREDILTWLALRRGGDAGLGAGRMNALNGRG